LAQGSEFAFVLFSFAEQRGVLSRAVASPLVAAVALSMALTPLLLLAYEKLLLVRLGAASRPARAHDAIDEENPVIVAGFGRFGNIVGRLLRANGVGATVLDIDSDNVELLRKLGMKVFYGDASRLDLLRAAGAEKARLLVVAVDDHERVLEIVRAVKQHFPHLELLARAVGRSEAYELLEAGVTHVYRETFDTSLRVGVDALRLLGVRAAQALRAARFFSRHDEESVRELAALRKDKKVYISRARERIRDLEQLLTQDIAASYTSHDAAWDPTSLREEIRTLFGEDGAGGGSG
jgi:voltage-gated potassium channel Kch